MGSTVYRIAGEAFVIVLIGDSGTAHDSQAEPALKEAKAAGKNKIVVAPTNARGGTWLSMFSPRTLWEIFKP
jgi:hypothetical protein